MGRKKPDKRGRRGGGKRPGPREPRPSEAGHNRGDPGTGPAGPSRLLLTRVLRDGSIWDVYVATTPQTGARNLTELEFEGAGSGHLKRRYRRPVQADLLAALHSGGAVSRARLGDELDMAIRHAEAARADDSAEGTQADDSGEGTRDDDSAEATRTDDSAEATRTDDSAAATQAADSAERTQADDSGEGTQADDSADASTTDDFDPPQSIH